MVSTHTILTKCCRTIPVVKWQPTERRSKTNTPRAQTKKHQLHHSDINHRSAKSMIRSIIQTNGSTQVIFQRGSSASTWWGISRRVRTTAATTSRRGRVKRAEWRRGWRREVVGRRWWWSSRRKVGLVGRSLETVISRWWMISIFCHVISQSRLLILYQDRFLELLKDRFKDLNHHMKQEKLVDQIREAEVQQRAKVQQQELIWEGPSQLMQPAHHWARCFHQTFIRKGLSNRCCHHLLEGWDLTWSRRWLLIRSTLEWLTTIFANTIFKGTNSSLVRKCQQSREAHQKETRGMTQIWKPIYVVGSTKIKRSASNS